MRMIFLILSLFVLSTSSIQAINNTKYDEIITKIAKKYSLNPKLIKKIIYHESKFNAQAMGRGGRFSYVGLMQISTEHLNNSGSFLCGKRKCDLLRPETNIDAGARILHGCFLRYGKNEKGLNCYTGGKYSKKILSELKTVL